jgi:hypothetical protein
MLKDRTCTGCHQACNYGKMRFGTITYEEADRVRFKESQDAAARGEYGRRARRTKPRRDRKGGAAGSRILGLMHEDKLGEWEMLIKTCPERLYPPPGESGLWEADVSDPDQAAELAAAQAQAMEAPMTRGELFAQLGQEFPSDPDELEGMIVRAYREEKRIRELEGPPELLEQPDQEEATLLERMAGASTRGDASSLTKRDAAALAVIAHHGGRALVGATSADGRDELTLDDVMHLESEGLVEVFTAPKRKFQSKGTRGARLTWEGELALSPDTTTDPDFVPF